MSTSQSAVFEASRHQWAGRPWGGSDVRVSRVRLFDTPVWLFHRRHGHEWARRARGEAAAVDRLADLDLLMDMPVDAPLPLASFSSRERRMLAALPRGAAHIGDGHVTRLFSPALTPLLVVANSREWEVALAHASRFGAYCPRAVMVDALPPETDVAVAEASLYGIGVLVRRDGELHEYLAPEPLAGWQPTTAWWRMCELAYLQVASKAQGGLI